MTLRSCLEARREHRVWGAEMCSVASISPLTQRGLLFSFWDLHEANPTREVKVNMGRTTKSVVLHRLFLVALGAAGWIALALGWPTPAALPSRSSALLFLSVAAGARLLAFPMSSSGAPAHGESAPSISLDAAIFVAANACLGAPLTSLAVGVMLAVDLVARQLVESQPHQHRRHLRLPARPAMLQIALEGFYLGGISAGLLLAMSRLWSVGWGMAPRAELVLLQGLSFLVAHYLVQAVQLKLAGEGWRAVLRRNALGILAEASLLPLAAVIVLVWDPTRPLLFTLLGITYVLVNVGFHRLAVLASVMRRRARELEVLNRTSQALAKSLDTKQLIPAVLAECSRALVGSKLEAFLRTPAAGSTAAGFERFSIGSGAETDDKLAALWLDIEEAQLESDLPDGEPGGWRSRLVVPLRMYGETLGVLVVQSPEWEAFGLSSLRLLEAVAAQAAAAVENVRLYNLANIDGLTGLYCRRYFDIRVAEEIERARRFGSSFSLIMLDLDNFKRLNDALGHLAGDRALREVAAIAAGQLRGVDLAARYGGEELAFLLPRTSLADAHAVAERIRKAVGTCVLVEGAEAWHITASLGVAGWTESGEGDPSTMVGRADVALYRAKRAGKNRVEVDLVNFELTPSLAPVRRRA